MEQIIKYELIINKALQSAIPGCHATIYNEKQEVK